MIYDELMNNELVKFYFSLNPENHLVNSFKEEAFEQFSRLVERHIPAKELGNFGLEFAGGYDDMCVDGYSYGNGDFTLYFDDYLIDEEELEYTDNEAHPVGIFVTKKGFEVLGPDIAIGKPIDISLVDKAIDGSMNGRLGTADLGGGRSIIECAMEYFDLVFIVQDGLLESVNMLAISMPS